MWEVNCSRSGKRWDNGETEELHRKDTKGRKESKGRKIRKLQAEGRRTESERIQEGR